MVLDNFRRRVLTKTQREALVVFGTKPKKAASVKVKDKRGISLLNADYKVNSGIPTTRLSKLSKKGLSPAQYVSGEDRQIHHCIGRARDAAEAGNENKKEGSAILDLDFKAAFDLMMACWPIMVLLKKGCGEVFANWLRIFFEDVISTVVVNNVIGATIRLLRSLRQGDIPSMLLFAYGLDPYLERLRQNLRGIQIHEGYLPVEGPVQQEQPPLPPLYIEDRFTAFGYADDVKCSITSMEELVMVDNETKPFEKASGCELHRVQNPDPSTAKVKLMPLGKWRNSLKQEDIPAQCQHITLSDHLDMLGLPLFASLQKTLKHSGDEVQEKTKKTVGSWLLRRMSLTQRPWSINTYLLPKIYHRCHVIPLRVCDMNGIKKQINRFLFCDQLEKPGPILQYRPRSSGGLQVHNIDYKSKAMLLRSYLETAIIDSYQHFPLQEAIFRYFVLEDHTIARPRLPKCYSLEFIAHMRLARSMGHNLEIMTSKDWYLFLLNLNVLEEEKTGVDGTISRVPVKCKTEMMNPDVEWFIVWDLAKMRGISNDSRTFIWRLLNNLHTSEQRLHTLHKTPSPLCKLCQDNQDDNIWNHSFTKCSFSHQAMEWMINILKKFDPSITKDKAIFLQINPQNTDNVLPCVWLIAESLQFIWAKRRAKEHIQLDEMIALITARCKNLKTSELFKNHVTNVLLFLNT